MNPKPTFLLQWGLSVTTLPLLVGLGLVHCVQRTVQQWGEESEELLRGDRLPVLTLREDTETSSLSSSDTEINR
ncbi:MAG: hypothetical protein ACKN9E_18580 [Microcystaceae cyanobacterium]|nr:hypothetical protein [Merismopediaceae bacterium]